METVVGTVQKLNLAAFMSVVWRRDIRLKRLSDKIACEEYNGEECLCRQADELSRIHFDSKLVHEKKILPKKILWHTPFL